MGAGAARFVGFANDRKTGLFLDFAVLIARFSSSSSSIVGAKLALELLRRIFAFLTELEDPSPSWSCGSSSSSSDSPCEVEDAFRFRMTVSLLVLERLRSLGLLLISLAPSPGGPR